MNNMTNEFTFLGGATEVGSTGFLLRSDNFSCIFDYGLTPTSPPKYPLQAPSVDYVFLTHAHIDHSGMMPWLTSKYDTKLYTTPLTLALANILHRDNLKISELEGFPPMYSKTDIREMGEKLYEIDVNLKYYLDDFQLEVHSAGHIPGSVMFKLTPTDNEASILFTGDINTIDTRLVSGTRPVKCDILVMESTYSGRDHELRAKIEYNFLEKVKEIIEGGGKVIVPVFAVGRTQEMLLILADLDMEIWLDGLGGEVTRLFLQYPSYLRNAKKLRKIFEQVHRVRTRGQRRKALEGGLIVTTSGLLDGGPVLSYIRELKNNPKNGLLLTGYQVKGSNGRSLLEKGVINMDGSMEKINMDVNFYDFSAHAGHKELLDFVTKCDPEHVVLYHGDNRDILKQELESDYVVHIPVEGKAFKM